MLMYNEKSFYYARVTKCTYEKIRATLLNDYIFCHSLLLLMIEFCSQCDVTKDAPLRCGYMSYPNIVPKIFSRVTRIADQSNCFEANNFSIGTNLLLKLFPR